MLLTKDPEPVLMRKYFGAEQQIVGGYFARRVAIDYEVHGCWFGWACALTCSVDRDEEPEHPDHEF